MVSSRGRQLQVSYARTRDLFSRRACGLIGVARGTARHVSFAQHTMAAHATVKHEHIRAPLDREAYALAVFRQVRQLASITERFWRKRREACRDPRRAERSTARRPSSRVGRSLLCDARMDLGEQPNYWAPLLFFEIGAVQPPGARGSNRAARGQPLSSLHLGLSLLLPTLSLTVGRTFA